MRPSLTRGPVVRRDDRHAWPHEVRPVANLLGISFVLLAGLKLTNHGGATLADEVNAFAALAFLGACVLSYLSIRAEERGARYEVWADYFFLAGLFSLSVAVAMFYTGHL